MPPTWRTTGPETMPEPRRAPRRAAEWSGYTPAYPEGREAPPEASTALDPREIARAVEAQAGPVYAEGALALWCGVPLALVTELQDGGLIPPDLSLADVLEMRESPAFRPWRRVWNAWRRHPEPDDEVDFKQVAVAYTDSLRDMIAYGTTHRQLFPWSYGDVSETYRQILRDSGEPAPELHPPAHEHSSSLLMRVFEHCVLAYDWGDRLG